MPMVDTLTTVVKKKRKSQSRKNAEPALSDADDDGDDEEENDAETMEPDEEAWEIEEDLPFEDDDDLAAYKLTGDEHIVHDERDTIDNSWCGVVRIYKVK